MVNPNGADPKKTQKLDSFDFSAPQNKGATQKFKSNTDWQPPFEHAHPFEPSHVSAQPSSPKVEVIPCGTASLTRLSLVGFRREKYPINKGKVIIGRYDEASPVDIPIMGDDTISRRSISICAEKMSGGVFGFKLKVLHTTNPIKVNGQLCHQGFELYLRNGDIIGLGKTKLKFEQA